MFVPGEGLKLGALPDKPEGAKWAEPLEIHSAVTYRTDEEGYLKPGFSHIFLVASDGGAPRQLSFGQVHDNGPLSWTPDGRSILFSSNRSSGLGARSRSTAKSMRSTSRPARSRALTDRNGPDTEPVVSPDGRLIAYTGFDDKRARLSRHPSST